MQKRTRTQTAKSSLSPWSAPSALRPDNKKGSCKPVLWLRVLLRWPHARQIFNSAMLPRPLVSATLTATACVGHPRNEFEADHDGDLDGWLKRGTEMSFQDLQRICVIGILTQFAHIGQNLNQSIKKLVFKRKRKIQIWPTWKGSRFENPNLLMWQHSNKTTYFLLKYWKAWEHQDQLQRKIYSEDSKMVKQC